MEPLSNQLPPINPLTNPTDSQSSKSILYIITGVVLLIAVAVMAVWKFSPTPWFASTISNQPTPTSDESFEKARLTYVYDEQFRTGLKIFYCAVVPHTESNCRLYVSDVYGSKENLGVTLDYGSQRTGLLLSPDKRHVAAILEREVIVISTDSLVKKIVAQVPKGMVYGLYTGFPSFVPHGRWLNDDQLELELFKEGTGEPYDDEPALAPIEKKTVSISAQ